MQINPTFAFASGATQTDINQFEGAVDTVISYYDSVFTNVNVTLNVNFAYGEKYLSNTNSTITYQPMANATPSGTFGLGASEYELQSSSYSTLLNLLQTKDDSLQSSAYSTLPAASNNPFASDTLELSTAQAKALGIAPTSSLAGYDGVIGIISNEELQAGGFSGDWTKAAPSNGSQFYMVGSIEHELSEVMGRFSDDGRGGQYTLMDMFRYSAPGVRQTTNGNPAYFSIDNGNHVYYYWNNPALASGDLGDWAASGPGGADPTGPDSYLNNSSPGVVNEVSAYDLDLMNVLGWNLTPPDTTPPSVVVDAPLTVPIGGSGGITSSLLRFDDNDSSHTQERYTVVTGPAHGTLLRAGLATSSFTQADIDNGIVSYSENGSAVSSDSFTFTVTDAAGNTTAAQQFQIQMAIVIEGLGTTSLVQVGNGYFLDNSSLSGPQLQYSGSPWTVGEFGAWTPIGAEPTASGYEVAFKLAGSSLYTVWNTDSSGNMTSDTIGSVYGDSTALESLESSFHQDLNGDGVIGIPSTTVIESFGSTSLAKSGNDFYLNSVSTGTGPVLQYGGVAWAAGQWGGWTLIGAEATASGYQVAFKLAGTSQYTVWNADGNGNLIGPAFNAVYGDSSALESLESSFHQDLNGDGTIGIPATTVIESFGSISLARSGNDYYLNNGGTGPELVFLGAAWTAGTFGAYTPIGAEATASGYEVAFKLTGSNIYTVWNADANGNLTNDTLGSVAGNNATLEGLESSFHQDLNGDGTIGVPPTTVIESFGSTSLVQYGNEFYLNGTGPELQYGGSPWTAGEFGGYAPIGAEATASGYEIAFKNAATGLFTVWNTDTNGNFTNDLIGSVSSTSTALEFLETGFHQDLNSDGTTGIPGSTTIDPFGSTSLVKVGGDYFMYASSGIGSELAYGGSPWTAGEFGAWAPIGAEATASGYEVAFKFGGADLYTVWNTDANGNLVNDTIGSVAGSSLALQLLEPGFHQDLNNDGTIGIPGSTIIETSGLTSLVQTGSDFFMYATNNGTGPELKYGGTPWTAGEWGAWTPIGAEATAATVYEVAFKLVGSDLYTVWNTDSNGNITTNVSGGTVAGNSTTLETLESNFDQDLNGDGVIGVPGSHSSGISTGPAALVSAGNDDTFVFGSTTSAAAIGGSAESHIGFAFSIGHPPGAFADVSPLAATNDGHATAINPEGPAISHWIEAHAGHLLI